ncbi:MAG: hypothetical protein MRY83_01990, partial [Flavobacteriales bacterium]|nr:hypothetical protein [Flavobacteriales bacterium]
MVYTQNVGVSEDGSAPNQLLHIHENGSTGKGVKITNSTTGNGSSDGVDLINNGSDFEINQLENAAIRLSTNGTERLTLLGNGNIGFGIVNPDEYLTLNGDLKIRGTNRLHFSNTSDRVYIHGPSTDHLAFGTAGTERIRINASGFVGIGSSSPGNLLDLNTTSTSSGIEFDNRLAISGFSGDNWLRLNQSSNFSNGTYTPTHFRTDGELRQGGTDYGAYNIQTNGEIYANDYIIAMGGLHIGGTSDPGTDNLVVDGNIQGNGSMTHNGGTVYRYENLATYNSGSSSVTGSMKITLPKSWSNTMMNVTIKGYNYNGTTGHWEVKIGGYNYSGSSSWVNTSAEISGRPPFSQVRLAHDGTNCIILLGNTASTWNYPKIQVTNMMAGHSQYNSGWGSGWSIAPITSESGITSINTPALTGSGSTAGGDISGPFSNLQINSGVVGQAEIATGGVASAEVSDNSLTAADLASNSVGADEIATDAVRAAEIQADAVGASEIAAGAVGTSEIANGSIAAADLSSMGASANQVMQYNGSSWSAVNSSGIGNDGYIGNASSHTVGGTLNMSGNTLFVNGDDGITDVTGTYGSVQTAGSGSGGWEGYSINGRYVLMSDDNNAVGLYNDVDNRWIIRHERNSDLRFYDPNSTSEIARFNTSGNLGIGNTNPGYKLDVTGTIHGDVINVNGAYSLPTAAGTTSQYLRGDGTWQTLGWTYSGGQLYPTAWPGTDVGIGTNSPNSLFQLYEDGGGATQFTITNASASAQDAYISFQNGATYEWSVGFDNSDGDEFKISRGVAPGINEALSINSSNVVRINNAYNLPNSAAGSPATQFLRGDGTWASPSGSSDGNGIYDGNGTVANGTAVTLSGSLNFDAGTMYMDGAANEIG